MKRPVRKKTSALLGMGLLALVLSLTVSPGGVAAGQQLGDNFTVIVTEGKLTNNKMQLIVKSGPKAKKKVGNCAGGEFGFVDAELAVPGSKDAAVPVEATIIIPGVSGIAELKQGWKVGSWRAGGKCGPGYEAFLAHVVEMP